MDDERYLENLDFDVFDSVSKTEVDDAKDQILPIFEIEPIDDSYVHTVMKMRKVENTVRMQNVPAPLNESRLLTKQDTDDLGHHQLDDGNPHFVELRAVTVPFARYQPPEKLESPGLKPKLEDI